MSPLTIEAPTDAQLSFIRELCRERGYPMAAVHSKTEASLLANVCIWLAERSTSDRAPAVASEKTVPAPSEGET